MNNNKTYHDSYTFCRILYYIFILSINILYILIYFVTFDIIITIAHKKSYRKKISDFIS